jgi:hypothetical protein
MHALDNVLNLDKQQDRHLPSTYGSAYATPLTEAPGWQFRFTPYAWAPSVNGDVTVHGQTADIDFSFWDIFDLILHGPVIGLSFRW